MSATPRTDALSKMYAEGVDQHFDGIQFRSLARQLETELQEAQKENERIKSLEGYRAMGKQIADALDERDQLRQQLTEARAASAKLASLVNQWRKNSDVHKEVMKEHESIGSLYASHMIYSSEVYSMCAYELEQALQLNCGKELLEVVKLQHKIIEAIDEDDTCLGIHELRRDMKQALTKAKEIGL